MSSDQLLFLAVLLALFLASCAYLRRLTRRIAIADRVKQQAFEVRLRELQVRGGIG